MKLRGRPGAGEPVALWVSVGVSTASGIRTKGLCGTFRDSPGRCKVIRRVTALLRRSMLAWAVLAPSRFNLPPR